LERQSWVTVIANAKPELQDYLLEKMIPPKKTPNAER
jgi:hypothetical protein